MVKTLKAGDTLHSIGTNEANFGKYASAANNKKFMQHVLKNNVQCQLIVPDGFRDFGCDPASYRFLSPDVIGQIYFTIYHDYLTMIDWHEPPKAIFIRSKPIAETYLRQFKFLWNLAKEPPADQLSQWRHTWKETYLPKIFPAGGKH